MLIFKIYIIKFNYTNTFILKGVIIMIEVVLVTLMDIWLIGTGGF